MAWRLPQRPKSPATVSRQRAPPDDNGMADLPSGFSLCEVPARLADLAFSFALPTGWAMPDLPNEDTDFSAPQTFAPLTIAMAPFAAREQEAERA